MEIAHRSNNTSSNKNDGLIRKLGKSPDHFTSLQKKCYQSAGNLLIKAERLKAIYFPALEMLAVNLALYQEAVTEINRMNTEEKFSGYIQKFKNNVQQISPQMTLKREAENAIFKCLKQFGMDPKSDKELGSQNNGQLSLYEELFKKLQAG